MARFTSTTSTVALALALLVPLGACKGNYEAKVDGVWIPQADGVESAPEGPTATIPAAGAALALPDADEIVRLAIARDVPWTEVKAAMAKVEAAGAEPVLLVGKGPRLKAFRLGDELESERTIQVFTTTEGKACVGPPGAREFKCVQRSDRTHIDRAFMRELVREAVKTYRIQDVQIEIAPALGWGDVVRALDAVRTCCGDTPVRVRLGAAS